VDGAGISLIEQAGIVVRMYDKKQNELHRLIEVFEYCLAEKKTFITLKMATSLDGQMALASGESKWITGEKARNHAHIVRSYHDAIIIGVNTLLEDDPKLNIRFGEHQDKALKIIVLDPKGRSLDHLPDSNLVKTHGAENVIVAGQGLALPSLDQELDLDVLKQKLFAAGIRSAMVEGGAHTISSFLKQQAAQRVYQYIAPTYLGRGIQATSGVSIEKMAQKISLNSTGIKRLGRDLVITGRL
jgi:diaminohydroxyphosphoribosylaminopyrimidine deaminase/5-amino-6-(5-phosphoribosylamino)uracil reductase